MYEDEFQGSGRYVRTYRDARTEKTLSENPDQDMILRIVMASMPLAGLIFGVVALAIWHAA